MGKNERQAYLNAIRLRYRRARKEVKVSILNEFCTVCGYNRKYAIRLLGQRLKAGQKRRTGPKPIYASPELLLALKGPVCQRSDVFEKAQGCHSIVVTILWDDLQSVVTRNTGQTVVDQCRHH